MTVNECFRTIYCINLDRRSDRWVRARRRFDEQGILSVNRYPAVNGKLIRIPEAWDDVPGAYGCLMSHLGVVCQARESGSANALIFEDDVVFDECFRERFATSMAQVPQDWDMLLLGGSHWSPPERVAGDIYRAVATVATHAYALKRTIFDSFIDLNRASNRPVNCNNTILQGEFRCYCISPDLAWQEDGYSDIAERALHFGKRPEI